MNLSLSEAPDGTPQAHAGDVMSAYYAFGHMHARYRPLQALLIGAAARGQLSQHLLARPDLAALDSLVHRMDFPETGKREAHKLDAETAAWLDAYCAGFARGLKEHGRPFELRIFGAQLPLPTRQGLISSLLLSAFLGLGEGQERMERLILEAADAGATILPQLFSPALDGATSLRGFGARATAPGFFSVSGGSNAWAVDPSRSASGGALLAGDPHLQLNQMPALFLEVALRVGDDYWLGASIPGLPGLALGRNRNVAWSGTFGVADNVDMYIEDARNKDRWTTREVRLAQRFGKDKVLRFTETALGTLEREDGRLSVRWFGKEETAQALAGYMRLPLSRSTEQACRSLDAARTLSLHYVIADRSGDVRHKHCGFIPRRAAAQLFPFRAAAPLHKDTLPELGAADGFVCSANEARVGTDGSPLSTFAQPRYRSDRIATLLRARSDHDVASFGAIAQDLWSGQAARLLPIFMPLLPAGPIRRALSMWDFHYTESAAGAHAFALVYRAALQALAPLLGGEVFWTHVLTQTEAPIWWAAALDRFLASTAVWQQEFARRVSALTAPRPFGQVQRVTLSHLVLGGIPGFDRGSFALPGSLATVRQGTVQRLAGTTLVVAPAYRFITDLSDDCAYTQLPGGIDGSAFSPSYDCWLDDYWAGRSHRLSPPPISS